MGLRVQVRLTGDLTRRLAVRPHRNLDRLLTSLDETDTKYYMIYDRLSSVLKISD